MNKPLGNMDILLIGDVEGIGRKGELVNVKKFIARNHLFAAQLAVYPTEENIRLHKTSDADVAKSLGPLAVTAKKLLGKFTLKIPMSNKHEWTLEKQHVRVALRRTGVNCTDESIVLPPESVESKSYKDEEFSVMLSINKVEQFPVQCHILPIPSGEDFADEAILEPAPDWLQEAESSRPPWEAHYINDPEKKKKKKTRR